MRDHIEWTEERKASLASLWNSGQSAERIAEFFDTSMFAIVSQVNDMRSRGANLQKRQRFGAKNSWSSWSSEDREEVFRRKALGATCESIAYYIGRSPFAVRQMLQRSI